eukprot:13343474-Alexandrium_andersonii.AAC.1
MLSQAPCVERAAPILAGSRIRSMGWQRLQLSNQGLRLPGVASVSPACCKSIQADSLTRPESIVCRVSHHVREPGSLLKQRFVWSM